MSHVDALAVTHRVNMKRCGRCGKIAYESQGQAMTALQTLAVLRLLEFGEVGEHEAYRCHPKFNREVWHLTSQRHGVRNESIKGKIAAKHWAEGPEA